VRADAALLERSLANVLANALRHNPEGEPVRLEAGVVGDDVHLRVVDRGPGIPASQRARVVAPFQRLGDQRTDDGVGLGLAIAVGFVEAMDGAITLDDTPGGGLTVTIVLHRATPGHEVAA
jgi:two-component system sensor histidine kinase KdpD